MPYASPSRARFARALWLGGLACLHCVLGAGCAHESLGTSRIVDGRPTVGRVVSAEGYASALRLALVSRGLLSADAAATARVAIVENPGDDEVIALAIDVAGDDESVRQASNPWRGRSCAVDIALAHRAAIPAPLLASLVPRCPLATAPAIYASLDAANTEAAGAIALRAQDSRDVDTLVAVLEALIRLGEPAPLEAFVAFHLDEPRIVARVAERAHTQTPILTAAMLAPLSELASYTADAAIALHAAGRTERAREVVLAAPLLGLEDTLRLAEIALSVGETERSLELAEDACRRGASSRCDAIAARALDALGRPVEARERRASRLP